MALFMVMDFEAPGDTLFSKNFCGAGYYTDGNPQNGLILKGVGWKQVALLIFWKILLLNYLKHIDKMCLRVTLL